MEKEQLREAPYEVGRSRLFDLMNSHAGAFTHVGRLVNPEGARIAMHDTPGARVAAWHQSGGELAVLYTWNEAWILFDRFHVGDETDTVVVVSAATLELQSAVSALLWSTPGTDDDPWSRTRSND